MAVKVREFVKIVGGNGILKKITSLSNERWGDPGGMFLDLNGVKLNAVRLTQQQATAKIKADAQNNDPDKQLGSAQVEQNHRYYNPAVQAEPKKLRMPLPSKCQAIS